MAASAALLVGASDNHFAVAQTSADRRANDKDRGKDDKDRDKDDKEDFNRLPISSSLVSALRFDREQSRNPGAAFIGDKGLLVGFGDNLYHQDLITNTSQLVSQGRLLLQGSTREDAAENVRPLTIGTTGTLTHTVEDRFGNVLHGTMVVEAIHDLPDDFLVTEQTESNRFTGSTYGITLSLSGSQGDIGTFKTTYNALTRLFPLGWNMTFSPTPSDFDRKAAALMPIAAQIVENKFGAQSAILLTDLQEDFGWRKFFRGAAAIAGTIVLSVGVASLLGLLPVALPVLAAIALIVVGAGLLLWASPISFRDLGNLPRPAIE
jgi:hypothetical protein